MAAGYVQAVVYRVPARGHWLWLALTPTSVIVVVAGLGDGGDGACVEGAGAVPSTWVWGHPLGGDGRMATMERRLCGLDLAGMRAGEGGWPGQLRWAVGHRSFTSVLWRLVGPLFDYFFFRALWVRAGSRDCHFALVSGPPARCSWCCATDAGVRQLAIHVRHGCSIHAQRTSGVAIRDDHAVTCAAGAMLCATQAAAATTTPGRQDEMVEEKRGLVSTKDQQTRTRAPRTMSRRDPNQKREERKKEDL